MITAQEAKNLGQLSHQNAIDKGWWKTTPEGKADFSSRNFHEITFLAITELAEAFEVYRDGRPLTEIWAGEKGKPEGFPIEMADFVIRVLETMTASGVDVEKSFAEELPDESEVEAEENLGEALMYISGLVTDASSIGQKSEGSYLCLASSVVASYKLAEKHNFDLTAAVKTKMEYNTTRPIRHGNKLA